MARLLAETCDLRQRVEAELDLHDDGTSWLDYRLYLFRMYGFHAAVERALAIVNGLDAVVPDATLRNKKVHLLAHDLVALGVERRDLTELPRIPVPAFDDVATALGWMCVLEASTLQNATLARQLARRLPLEMESASAYLGCYGDEAEARWIAFGAAVEAYAARDDIADRVIAGAVDCLTRLHRWLRPSSSQTRIPSRLHA